MSQQGGRPTGPTGPTGPEDDWWGQLYDDSTDDTGPTAAPDSLDDRFASASGTVARRPGPGPDDPTAPPPPAPAPPGPRAPWWASANPPGGGVPGPRTAGPPGAGDEPPGAGGPPRPAGPPGLGDDGPRGAGPSGPERPPQAGDGDSGDSPVDFPPGPARPGTTPPAAAPRASGAAEPPSPPPPPPSPASGGRSRGGDPRGLTTSGSGAADLTEPPAAVPPPRTPSGLPPLPSSFVPSPPAGPDGADRDYVGSGPPTYDAEPTALPPADPDGLDGLVPDTVLEGARYGTCTLRAVSVRGDSARYRGEPRRDALLVARFGAGEQALVLVAMATGARATAGAHRAAAEVCRWIGRAVGRSHARLAEDLRAARRGDLKSGLHRLTDRSLGRLRAGAAEQGLAPDEYAATLRCLLLPADPECRTRVFFGVGAGGLLRLRDGTWREMEPDTGDVTGEPVLGFGSPPHDAPHDAPNDAPSETPDGDRLTMDLGITTAPGPYDGPTAEPPRAPFRFRASVARPGDVLLMCTAGLAEPLVNEPGLGELLARRWAGRPAPGLGEFLADSGVRVKGYADDRTAAAVWEA
ncbi:protein phosphatase 2C domain-containing protein [Streptomyces coelicoflavus]|uniref:protein phosphatase 2C domain-containing protein n=1 Tax=Streptomyces coelicoflavus TaxID=285562 RepID=UPI0024ADCA0E|nr:protein phosphatase 2C domain-containing protein [Streptomyces coelicoflavus]MDI6520655.1 protein phosphatase 2C domain-containing protein [Streptomyces coelicoflavus]